MWVNGVLDDESGPASVSITDNIRIGGQYTAFWEVFNGQLEEFRIWDVVRSEQEIRDYMCRNLTGSEAGLLVYFSFDNSTGTTLPDFSANNNNGTLTNMDNTDWVASSAFNTWLNTTSTTWSEAGNWSNGIPTSGANVSIYNYTNEPDIPASQTFGCLYLGNGITTGLTAALTVNSSLIINKDLNLNGQTITLGSSGYLFEDAGSLSGTSGQIQTSRTLSNIDENVAGLGAEITTSANMGSTTIIRSQAAATNPVSINRKYQITPATNTGLNATMVFHYEDNELNGNAEANLKLYRSTDGSSWDKISSSSVNTTDNTLTLTGIDGFSYWTASDASSYSDYTPDNYLRFDGLNDYVSLSGLYLSGYSAITLETWVLFMSFNGEGDANITNVILGGDEKAVLRVGDGGIANNLPQFVITIGGSQNKLTASMGLETGTWYHLAGTYDGATMKLYINGILDQSASVSGTIDATNTATLLGGATNERYLEGRLDEVRIWNDARTETEMRQNMHKELSNAFSEANLLAYYKLNSTSGTTALDSKAGYTGALTNYDGQSGYWDVSPAKAGPKTCLDFDGTDDYVNCGAIPIPSNITIEAWINIEYLGGSEYKYGIVGTQAGTNGYMMLRIGDGTIGNYDLPEFAFYNGSGVVKVTGTTTLDYERWYHVAATYDGSDMKIYVDGRLENSASETGATTSGLNMFIGREELSSDGYFEGLIDEVRIWNTARTGSQIREDMCRNLTGNETNLLAYYNFDNTSGSTLQDFSGNGYDGTNMNGASWVRSRAYNTWLKTSIIDWDDSDNWSLNDYPDEGDDSDNHSFGVYYYEGGASPEWDDEDIYANNAVFGENVTILTDGYYMYLYGNLILKSNLNMQDIEIEFLNEESKLFEEGGVLYADYDGQFNEIYVSTYAKRDISSGTTENVAGLGVSITPSTDIQDVIVECGYGDITKPFPISRQYYIEHNSTDPVNATVAFHYYDSELNGQNESDIQLYKSTNGVTWTVVSGAVHDAVNNTFTISGNNVLDGTSWTMSDGYSFVGNALDFERDDTEYAGCGTMNLSGSALTLECWVNVESFQGNPPYISSIIGTESGGNAAMLRFGDGDIFPDQVQFVLGFSGGQVKLTGSSRLETNRWYHIAGVYEGSGENAGMKIYIDGVEEASNAQTGIITSNADFNIANNSSRYLDGKIEEVRIWSDARTVSEIRQNMCQPLTGNEDGLFAYYNFNANSGATLTDVSGNGHNGTLYNTPTWVTSDAFAIWLGNYAYWENDANWSSATAPGFGSNVGITNLNTYYSYAVIESSLSVNNLVISENKSAQINMGYNLTVNNLFSYNHLEIRAYNSMAANGTGSLIITGESSGDIWVERYLDVQANYDDKWHYVSSPVNGQLLNNSWMNDGGITNTPAYQFYRFDEPTNYWIIYGSTGDPVAFNDTEFVEARGYCLTREWDGSVYFKGTARTSDVTYAATYNTDGGYGNTLVGNPYPCFLNATSDAHESNNFLTVNAGLIDDSYEGIYLWDESAAYDGSSYDYKVICNTPVSGFDILDQDYLAPAQGFMVKVSAAGDLQFNENMQTHSQGAFFKEDKETWPSLELKVSNGVQVNYTLVAFNQDMTKGLDPSYDAGKMKGNPSLALYTKLVEDNGKDFAVQALPYFRENYSIPVGIDISQPGGYTFEVAKMDQIPDEVFVYFEDLKTKAVVNLKETDSYTCVLEEAGQISDRFLLHFTLYAFGTEELEANTGLLQYWTKDKRLQVYNPELKSGHIQIFTALGQPVSNALLKKETHQQFQLDVSTGYYLVKIAGEDFFESGKIYVE